MRKWVAHRRVYLNGTGAAGGSEGFMGWVAGTSVGVDVRVREGLSALAWSCWGRVWERVLW